jgi:hypothetical protein
MVAFVSRLIVKFASMFCEMLREIAFLTRE